MANWESLLGLPLERALDIARTWGMEPKVLVTCAPRRKGEEASAVREGTMRVIRAREMELTVSVFPDGDPKASEE